MPLCCGGLKQAALVLRAVAHPYDVRALDDLTLTSYEFVRP
jgi:hypothetical protein